MECGVSTSCLSSWETAGPSSGHRCSEARVAMKILCDHMLGSLARWLRFMGYDTAYPEPGPDRTLVECVRTEDRILLTRDKELAARVTGTVRIHSDILDDQIREVAASLPLWLVNPL